MGLSQPRAIFGIHSVSPYRRSDGTFYGIMKVLDTSSLSMSGELVDLTGGSQKYPWASEDGLISAEMSLAVSQFEDFMFELFLGGAVTTVNAETTGNVSTAVNKYGTSIINASNGISGVSATSADEGDLKFGRYVIKALSATTFDLYCSSDVDLGRGNDAAYQNDALKLNASPLSIGSTLVDALTGLTFTKVGTPAFVTGDTATFEVRPIGTGGAVITVGGVANQTFPEFGAVIMAQKRGNNELTEIDAYRCKAAGMPIGFETSAWSKTEIAVKLLYDSTRDGIFQLRHVKAT